MALLLSSFGASNLSAAGGTDNDANKLTEAFNRFGRLKRWIKKWIGRLLTCLTQSCIECCRRQISARRGKLKILKVGDDITVLTNSDESHYFVYTVGQKIEKLQTKKLVKSIKSQFFT